MDRGEQLNIIDVREPHEYAIARIPGTKLIPLEPGRGARRRAEPERGDHPALPLRQAQRRRAEPPQGEGLHAA